MVKFQLNLAGRVITLTFPTHFESHQFVIDAMGNIQKMNKLNEENKNLKKELEEKENKIRYLENQLSQKIVECAFLKGEEPPAKEEEETNDVADNEDGEINFEEGEFEEF